MYTVYTKEEGEKKTHSSDKTAKVLLLTHPTDSASASSRAWIAAEIINKQLTWDQAKVTFTDRFQQSDYNMLLTQEFIRCRQGKTDTVQAYSDRFQLQSLVTQLNYADDNQLVIL